jgi:hypothetical protein
MLDSHAEREDYALTAIKQAVPTTLSDSRDILRRYESARRALHETLRRNKRLREESAALMAELAEKPG